MSSKSWRAEREVYIQRLDENADATIGCVYTNSEYEMYVESGTGPAGENNQQEYHQMCR